MPRLKHQLLLGNLIILQVSYFLKKRIIHKNYDQKGDFLKSTFLPPDFMYKPT